LATLYGLPGFSQDLAPPLALVVTGPVALSANGQGYSPNPFTVTAFTENLGTDTATSTTLSLTLPPGLALAGRDTAVHGLGDLAPGATTSTAWQVTASAQASQTVLTYLVTADATNAPSKVVSRSITLPAVATNAINDVIFVHGWHSSASDAQRGTGYAPLTRPLIDRYGTNYRALAVYQDLAYATPTGCDPAMPSPDMDTQGLKAHPDSINANVCDSEGALAYAASDLDDLVQRLQGPVAIISNSLGGGIVRGWLVLAQERSNDSSLDRVSTVIFTQGTQQGVFWTRLDQQTKESFGAFGQSLFRWVASKIGYDVTKPAAQDVVPQGAWYQSVNPVKPLPSQLHYYNFYSDIKVHFVQYCFIWKCGDLGTDDVGDTALLPGDPDPAKMPPDGGSRFLPGLHNAPDRHEFLWTNTYEEPLTSDGETNPWTGAAAAAFYDVTHDPGIHPAYIDNGANGSVLVDSCTGAGRVTPVEKILYILDHPANGCSS
jgi:hypothetical protein